MAFLTVFKKLKHKEEVAAKHSDTGVTSHTGINVPKNVSRMKASKESQISRSPASSLPSPSPSLTSPTSISKPNMLKNALSNSAVLGRVPQPKAKFPSPDSPASTHFTSPPSLSDSYGRPRNYSSGSSSPSAAPAQVTHSASLRTILNHTRHLSGSTPGTSPIEAAADVPEELVPVVTLIHAQQSRCYFEASVLVPDDSSEFLNKPLGQITWQTALIKLVGTDLAVWKKGKSAATGGTVDSPPFIINIADCEFEFSKTADFFDVKLAITNDKNYYLRAEFNEDLNYLFSGLILSQFEYKQLQEAFTGALFSSKAVYFSDIRTLLDPKNLHSKEECCILRFPFINDKWVRCYVVVLPPKKGEAKAEKSAGAKPEKKDKKALKAEKKARRASKTSNKEEAKVAKSEPLLPGKIEIYTAPGRAKKNLLATITNGRSGYSIYPESPEFIENNALIRLWGDCYINQALLEKIISEDQKGGDVINDNGHQRTRSRSRSIASRLSSGSLIRHSRSASNTQQQLQLQPPSAPGHRRTGSNFSLASSHSESPFGKRPGKMKKVGGVLQTKLCYLIPETHGSVSPYETMIRLLIPVMNAFHLYGRPEKFVSERTSKNSLLFGFPLLPHTQYLDVQDAYDVVSLNIENSAIQHWSSAEWIEVFKEMVHYKLAEGWNGAGSVVDSYRDSLQYQRDQLIPPDYLDYDPSEDFAHSNSNSNSNISGLSNVKGSSPSVNPTTSTSSGSILESKAESKTESPTTDSPVTPPARGSVDVFTSTPQLTFSKAVPDAMAAATAAFRKGSQRSKVSAETIKSS